MARGKNISAEEKVKILRLFKAGSGAEVLAERFGLTDRVIRKIVEEDRNDEIYNKRQD